MFAPRFVAVIFVSLLGIVKVAGLPLWPERALSHRDLAPFEPIRAYVKRQDLNLIPEQEAVKAPNGVTVPYRKRGLDLNLIPEEEATKAPNGVTVPYRKRGLDLNLIPEEEAVKAPNGQIVPYAKREEAWQGSLEL